MFTFQCTCGSTFHLRRVPTTLHCACGKHYDATEDNVSVRPPSEPREGPAWIPEAPCSNRGETLREMEGYCCGGRQVVDVFACSVHGECTHRNTRAGKDKPQPCLGCEDWAPG
jgi:hypothetical protein